MSELISGKEALIALANGYEVECRNNITGIDWANAKCLVVESFFNPTTMWSFRLKLRTMTINGIEVPAPFKPREGETYWFITDSECGYNCVENKQGCRVGIAAWRTEDEIKQVVDALRTIFKTN